MAKQAKPRNVATLLNRANLEYLSSIVLHTVLVAKEYVKISKKPKKVATLLNRAKLEYLSSIVFHTVLRTHSLATKIVWNTIDDRYSSFALLSNVATFFWFFAYFDIFFCH